MYLSAAAKHDTPPAPFRTVRPGLEPLFRNKFNQPHILHARLSYTTPMLSKRQLAFVAHVRALVQTPHFRLATTT